MNNSSSRESEGDNNVNPVHGDTYLGLLKDIHEEDEREKEEIEMKRREMVEACASVKNAAKKGHAQTQAAKLKSNPLLKDSIETQGKDEIKAAVESLGAAVASLQQDVKLLLELVKKSS